MDHKLKSRPVVAMVAAIAAVIVMLATTFAPPKPAVAAVTPRVSTQVVELVALPSPEQVISDIYKVTLGPVLAGAAAGVIAGFVGAGVVAGNVIYSIPVVGQALAPLITVVALAGAIVGAPIGAVFGAFSAIVKLVSNVRPPAASKKAAAVAPKRSTQAGSRPNRHSAKSSAPKAIKAAVPQQRSDTARAGSGRDRATAANRAGRH